MILSIYFADCALVVTLKYRQFPYAINTHFIIRNHIYFLPPKLQLKPSYNSIEHKF